MELDVYRTGRWRSSPFTAVSGLLRGKWLRILSCCLFSSALKFVSWRQGPWREVPSVTTLLTKSPILGSWFSHQELKSDTQLLRLITRKTQTFSERF